MNRETLLGMMLNLWPLYLASTVEGLPKYGLIILGLEAMLIWAIYERLDRRDERNADGADNRVTG